MTNRILSGIKSFWRLHGARSKFQFLTAAFLASLITACAGTPPPNQQITAAETAITHAEQQRIPDYQSPELTEARVKLTEARAAIVKKDMVLAERLAEQAELDADLAAARSSAMAAKQVNDELLKGNLELKNELQRKTGGQQ